VPENLKEHSAFSLIALYRCFRKTGIATPVTLDEFSRSCPTAVRANTFPYRRIGYDIVERNRNGLWRCSPLSCNGMARPPNGFAVAI
jgi:hypothetical protein